MDKQNSVLFITTKNIDYIRNTQEIRLLRKRFDKVDLVYSDKKNYIGRILEVWSKLKKSRIEAAEEIFIGFAPQLVLPFFYGKMKKKPITIDFFISVYDTLICDRKKFSPHGLVAKLCHKLDSRTLERAGHVITDTKAHAEYFIEEFKAEPSKFETIYLEADESIYYPRPQKKQDKYKDKFLVLYFGSILPLQGIDIILEALTLMKDEKDIVFQIIGPISDKYQKPIQDNVEYYNWLSQQELSDYIASADLCLGGHFKGEIGKARRTIPGKIYIYEMMEKNIILGDSPANHELYTQDDRHHFVKMSDPQALRDIIIKERDRYDR